MPKFEVSLETLRKHRYIDGAIDDGIKLYKTGGIELVQDDPTYFRCIVPIPGKEHKSVALTYTDDCRDLKDFYCGCTHLTKRHGLLSARCRGCADRARPCNSWQSKTKTKASIP